MAAPQTTAGITTEPAFVDPSLIIFPVKTTVYSQAPPTTVIKFTPTRGSLILNIETEGLNPFLHKIIAIGIQDPMVPNEQPIIIMNEDESFMVASLFYLIQEMNYKELVGYGLGFDYMFLYTKALKYNIPCKEFVDMKLNDLMQTVAQVKSSFVYKPQQPPKLSDLADYLWNFPKYITDLEMIKRYSEGDTETAYRFASDQITRILALYTLTSNVSNTPFALNLSGSASHNNQESFSNPPIEKSLLTFPEANAAPTWTARCPNDLSEWDVSMNLSEFVCPIDKTVIKRGS